MARRDDPVVVRKAPSADDAVMTEVVQRLVEAYQPESVYPLGSAGRGDANADSDHDIPLVAPDDSPEFLRDGRRGRGILRQPPVACENCDNRQQETRRMRITLKPDQEMVIQAAIQAGLIRSVDEFIDTAIEALPRRGAGFDKEKARLAGARIREIRRGVRLDLQGLSIRELAHAGHKY